MYDDKISIINNFNKIFELRTTYNILDSDTQGEGSSII